jgi:hypothetical protein
MRYIIHSFLLITVALLLFDCKSKKKPSLTGEDPVEVSDFIEFFPSRSLPYILTDTTLNRNEKDSLLIAPNIFTQFIPDSLLIAVFGKGAKLKIFPAGKVEGSGDETYLFAKVASGSKRAAFVYAFDDSNVLLDGMTLLRVDQLAQTQQSANMDKSYSLNSVIVRKNTDGTLSEGKEVYGLGTDSRKFELIMKDALDDKLTELINPIDTVSKKHKYAGDYGSGKLTLVSIRDGRRKDMLSFFIHFDKNSGGCVGELKGEATIKSATTAEYRQGGDPCVLRFNFSSSSVTLKEVEGCGSHRGLRCSFDGVYPKKKLAKPKSPAKKPSSRR